MHSGLAWGSVDGEVRGEEGLRAFFRAPVGLKASWAAHSLSSILGLERQSAQVQVRWGHHGVTCCNTEKGTCGCMVSKERRDRRES